MNDSSVSIRNYFIQNYSKCHLETSIFHSSEILNIMHIVALFLVPLYIFGSFCILTKTPNKMETSKWPLFYLHFCCCLLDVVFCILITPCVLFPSMSGFSVGFLNYVGTPIAFQTYIGVSVIPLMMCSISNLFESRHFFIANNNLRITKKPLRYCFQAFKHILVFTWSLPMILNPPDQELAKLHTLQQIPCPIPEFFTKNVYTLADDNSYKALLIFEVLIIVAFFCCENMIYICTCLYFSVFNVNSNMSSATRTLQQKFFFGTIIQVMVPIVFIVPPIFAMIVVLISGFYNQAINNVFIILFSLHGFCSTFTLIWLHKPYRDYFIQCLKAVIRCSFRNRVGSTCRSKNSNQSKSLFYAKTTV